MGGCVVVGGAGARRVRSVGRRRRGDGELVVEAAMVDRQRFGLVVTFFFGLEIGRAHV